MSGEGLPAGQDEQREAWPLPNKKRLAQSASRIRSEIVERVPSTLASAFSFGCIPHVEQDLEIELLAAISEVERGHLRIVTRGLGPFERFAVHLVEVAEDSFA